MTARDAEPTPSVTPSAKQSLPRDAKDSVTKPTKRVRAPLDGIMVVQDEHGRKVYVNGPPPRPSGNATPTARARPRSSLVYWSHKEKRWKDVPPPTPSAMREARSAAAEVVEYVSQAGPADSFASPSRAAASVQSAGSVPQASARRAPRPSYNDLVLAQLRQMESSARHPDYGKLALSANVSSHDIDTVIERVAVRHQVDPNLVRAIIKVESDFNPRALSSKGAMGLMQLMPETARTLKVRHPFDPQENVDAGVRHLKGLLNNFGGDLKLSLAAYNAGETAVARYNRVPDFAETRNYVKQITNMYWNGDLARSHAAPIRTFRDKNGVLTFTNE